MAGLSDADKAKLIAECQGFMKSAQTETRKYDEVVKLAAGDKDAAKLAKAANDAYKAYHKAGRALFDFVTDNKWKPK